MRYVSSVPSRSDLGHVPDQIGKDRIVSRDLCWREVAVARIVDAVTPMRVHARGAVVVDFGPPTRCFNRLECHGVDGLQNAAAVRTQALSCKELRLESPISD